MNGQRQARSRGQDGGNDNLQQLKEKVKEAIDSSKDPNGRELVEAAKEMAKICKKEGMTTSQIRHLFQEVQRITRQENFLYEVSKLRYKFAYTAGRHEQVRPLQEVAEEVLAQIKNKDHLQRFRDFFEAVVAYHRALGGKE